MTDGKENLELYLNDVYENECIFKIDKFEVEFIQRGIEFLVDRLVANILAYGHIWDEIEQDFVSFQSEGGAISRCKSDLIKVGSYYEGTKNDFPCEFDLIYPFYLCEETKCMDFTLTEILKLILSRTYQLILQSGTLKTKRGKESLCYHSTDGTGKLYFDRYLGRSRPAITMNFIYVNKSGLQKEVSVDLVPGAIIKDSNLEQIVDMYCALPPFRKEVMATGHVLMVDRRITFTETEVHLMRNVLSLCHRKVYRILKYLINGNGEAQVKHSSTLPLKGYSSYMIKTMLIYHHYACTKIDNENIGPCLLEVLNEMCAYTCYRSFPRLLKEPYSFEQEKKLYLLHDLQRMTSLLKSMQKSKESYDYKKHRKGKSLSEGYYYEHYRDTSMEVDLSDEELEKMCEISDFLLHLGD